MLIAPWLDPARGTLKGRVPGWLIFCLPAAKHCRTLGFRTGVGAGIRPKCDEQKEFDVIVLGVPRPGLEKLHAAMGAIDVSS